MRLFEFEEDNPLRVKLAAVASQLRGRTRDSDSERPMSVISLLNIFDNAGVKIQKDDLFDMIKKEPLVNIIDKVKGDDVIFKGQRGSTDPKSADTEDDQEKTVDKMADRANDLS